jgi:hypothetical protein
MDLRGPVAVAAAWDTAAVSVACSKRTKGLKKISIQDSWSFPALGSELGAL